MTEFRFTPHLRKKIEETGVPAAAIWHILNNPETTYDSFERDRVTGKRIPRTCRRCGTQQQKWTGTSQGEKFCVVVNPCCREAITFWRDQVDTPLRPDQVAAGVKGYRGSDGRWRS